MKSMILTTALRVVLPPLLGALGAVAATMAPAYYAAVCGTPPAVLTMPGVY